MLTRKSPEPVVSLASQAAHSADQAIRSTQRAASDALDSATQAVDEIHDEAVTPLLDRAADKAGALVARSAQAVRDGSRQFRARARQASATTVTYVRAEPAKAMLLAAAAGAALLAFFSFFRRSRDRE